MLNAVIIDDEETSIRILEELLIHNSSCKINIVGTALNLNEGVKIIKKRLPDIVFLDINMPGRNGLEIYNEFKAPNFKIIFCTAYQEYAFDALKIYSFGFILKPIDLEELEAILIKADHKFLEEQKQLLLEDKINAYSSSLKSGETIIFDVENGFIVKNTRNIEYCYAKDSCSAIVMQSQNEYIIKKSFKDLSKQLTDKQFYQTHKSYIVNIHFIRSFVHSRKNYVVLESGSKIPVSVRRTSVIANDIKQKIGS